MKTTESAIQIEHLTKTYGRNRGVTDLNLHVEKGDIFGFLGPNGAGKSTTIRSLLGLIHFQSGSIHICGMDAKEQHVSIMNHIGYMPSESMFYPSMRVSDVILLAARLHKKDCHAEAAKLCDRLEIDTTKKIEELSLGNRKKVSIVCAMQHRPSLFIFDEPTSGLDPLMQKVFFDLILEYNKQGTTCFLSSHVLSEVRKYCLNAAIIRDGKLILQDSVSNLTHTDSRRVKVVKDGIYEEFLYKGSLNDLMQDLTQHDITDLEITEPSLEEIFMHYYK